MAATTFTVRHGSIRLKVTLRESVREVHKAYQACHSGTRLRNGKVVFAFFWPTLSTTAKHVGGVVLPMAGGNLNELIPHEVAHAVISHYGGVLPHDDEAAATAIGTLSARIFRRLKKMGVMA